MTLAVDSLTRSPNTLIKHDDVNRSEGLSAGSPSGRTFSPIMKFGSFCPISTFESRSPNQVIDSSAFRFAFVGLFAMMDRQIVCQTISFVSVSCGTTYQSTQRLELDQPCRLCLVPGRQGVRNSGALSLEPFEMFGLNFQVLVEHLETGSSGERKQE